MIRKLVPAVLVLLLSVSVAKAQPNNVVSAIKYHEEFKKYKEIDALKKAQARIDTAANHPETRDKAKTWYHRGEIYYTIFSTNWDALKTKSTQTDPKKKEEDAFRDVDMKDLEKCLESYKKCIELDTKNDFADDAKKKLRAFVTFFPSKAIAQYNAKQFENAVASFESANAISQKYMNIIDTASLDNAALTAGKAKMYDKAAELYNKLIDLKYKPEENMTYLIEIYRLKGDDAMYKSTVTKGRQMFPNNYDFIVQELNMYIKAGDIEKAISIMDLAIQKAPDNAELYLVKGQTFSKLAFPDGEVKKPAKFDEYTKTAETSLLKATELKPNDSKILYSIGAFYNNWGAFIFNQAQNLTDLAKLAAEEKKAEEYFKKAIPFLEKEIQIDPHDKDALKALKQLYLKTGQQDTEKYKKVEDMLKN